MNKKTEKIIASASLIPIALAWSGGFLKEQSAFEGQIRSIVPELQSYSSIGQDIYQVDTISGKRYILSIDRHPGYNGPMDVGILVDEKGAIQTIAIIKSPDTAPYVKQVIDAKIPDAFVDADIAAMPSPDSVTNATLSSMALITAAKKAAVKVMQNKSVQSDFPDLILKQESISTANLEDISDFQSSSLSTTEIIKNAIVFFFFAAALFISSKKYPNNAPISKQNARNLLLGLSVVLLGFKYGSQFSLSTLNVLISGAWLSGLASYTPMMCLVLTVGYLLFSKKNIYCNYICPFGALQEGVSKVMNCPNPVSNPVMKWISRFFALAMLCFALYISNPSASSYEPFSKVFSFVGPLSLFILSAVIILFSLAIRKPWCSLFCPVTPFLDYINFWRTWLFKSKKQNTIEKNSVEQ